MIKVELTFSEMSEFIKKTRFRGLNDQLIALGYKRNTVVAVMRLNGVKTHLQKEILNEAFKICLENSKVPIK